MAIMTYNGVTLPYSQFMNFRQEVVYDDSRTDATVTKFDIAASFVVNANYLAAIAPDLIVNNGVPATTNASEIMRAIQAKLKRARRKLSVTFEGKEFIPKTDNESSTDARNGPQPQYCNIMQLSNATFLVQYHIIAHYVDINNVDAERNPINKTEHGGPVLYNRWTETVEIDNLNYTTRTREGKFMIRSDSEQSVTPDYLRTQMAVLSIPFGFLRQTSRYTVSPDGLALQYSITDKEQYKMPPRFFEDVQGRGAFEADGTYNEMSTRMGAKKVADVTVSLKGDKRTSQHFLTYTAIQIAAAKLALRGSKLKKTEGVFQKGFSVLEEAYVSFKLYKNEATVHIKLMAPASQEIIDGIAAFNGLDFTTPGSDANHNANYIPQYLDRGTANLLLQAATYYEPQLKDVDLNKARILKGGQRDFTRNGNESVQLSTQLPIPGQGANVKDPK